MMWKNLFAMVMPPDVAIGRLPSRLIPMLIVAYACLLPREFTFEVSGAAMFPFRFALFLMFPFAVGMLARYKVRPSIIDFVVLFCVVWFPISLYMTTSLEAGLVSGGSTSLDLALAYLVGRSAIRTPEDFRMLLLFMLPGLIGLVFVIAVESIGGRMLLRPMAARLLDLPAPEIYSRSRFGLLRATGPFPHPILAGVYLAALLPLAWYLSHNLWQRIAGLGVAFATVFTVSTTALVAIFIAIGFIIMNLLERVVRLPLIVLAFFYVSMALAAVSVASQSGLMSWLIRTFTLDPQSGFYRLLIWRYAGAEVLSHPLFGIGQRDWAKPLDMPNNSVDSYWLVLSLQYGVPATLGVATIVLGTALAVLRTQKFRQHADRAVGMGVMIFLVIVFFSSFTVHIWENLNAWMILVMGGGMSLATQARQVAGAIPHPGRIPPDLWRTGYAPRSAAAPGRMG